MGTYKIHFIHHSGFVLEFDTTLFVFDYYTDESRVLDKLLESGKKLYFFVSHLHGDHFNPVIGKYEERSEAYIVHKDVPLYLKDQRKKLVLEVGEEAEKDGIKIKMYGSTDAGGSFHISYQGLTVFHAGDLNWWHWAGEPMGDNLEARDNYFMEIGKIAEKDVDIAFFPVDARQQVAREWGVTYFLDHISCNLLIPMHAFGPRWVPSYQFKWKYPTQQIWIPKGNGDFYEGK